MCKMTNNSETGGRILVPHGMCIDMQRTLGYSQPTIRRALGGSNDTPAAQRIRKFAMEHGGLIQTKTKTYMRIDTHTWRITK